MKLLSRRFESLIKYKAQGKYCTVPTHIYPSKEDEYSSVPNYPPITKIDPNSEMGVKLKWFDKIKRHKTVEEKLFEVNLQRRWGWKCFMVHEGVVPFNNITFAQHMTRTHIIETENLPDSYRQFSDKSKTLLNEVKSDVIDAIEYQLDVRRHKLSEIPDSIDREKEMTKFIVMELNRVLMNNLWANHPHLKTIQVDYLPRIEASWKIESLVETYVEKIEDGQIPPEEVPEEYLERPSDKYIQYMGHPILQLRALHPLPEAIDVSEANILGYSVPVYKYDPHVVLGYELDRRFQNNIPVVNSWDKSVEDWSGWRPSYAKSSFVSIINEEWTLRIIRRILRNKERGFWPGDDREFSFMSYHMSNHVKHRPPTYGPEDAKQALQSQALFASFGWLLPLACYKGFSSYHDITYPMTTQTVLTDGREFTFAVYQLNTTELHWQNPMENLKCNMCWMTPTKPLYEAIENGKLKGFNEEVLQTLLQFYINAPRPLENVQLKPYLGESIKHVADYEDSEKAEWLEEKFKFCCSNRASHRKRAELVYEVKDWERIYKIKFPSRPADPRRRPFELRQNPYHEKLTFVEYIPKKLRPDQHLPKWRQRKYRKTFFPE